MRPPSAFKLPAIGLLFEPSIKSWPERHQPPTLPRKAGDERQLAGPAFSASARAKRRVNL